MPPPADLLRSRRAPTWLVAVIVVSLLPWSCVINLWFARRRLYAPLWEASNGLLDPSLQVALPSVLAFVALLRCGGLAFGDFGWRRADLPRALLATLLLWGVLHAIALAVVLVGDGVSGGVGIAGEASAMPLRFAGHLLGQLFGNALCEETLYRGFCLVQFMLILRARGRSPAAAIWLAALASAVVFALPHIPNRIFKERYADFGDILTDQATLLCSGLLLAWIYLRTRNLWWVVGLHSLANHPTVVLELPPDSGDWLKGTVAAIAVLVTALWPRPIEPAARSCLGLSGR